MCQVRLIIVFDHLCQVLHVCRLRKESIGMCQVRLIIFPAHIYLFQHVCRLRIRKYWDVSSAIDNSSWQFLQTQTFLQARDKKVLRCAKVRVISVPDHTYQFQHGYSLGISRESIEMCQVRLISVNSGPCQFQHVCRFGIRKYLDVPSTINKRFWQFLLILTCLQAMDKKVHWDVPSTIDKRSWIFLPISTCLRAKDMKVLRCAKYD